MREIRLSGSEGGGTGNSTGPPYPYQPAAQVVREAWCFPAAGWIFRSYAHCAGLLAKPSRMGRATGRTIFPSLHDLAVERKPCRSYVGAKNFSPRQPAAQVVRDAWCFPAAGRVFPVRFPLCGVVGKDFPDGQGGRPDEYPVAARPGGRTETVSAVRRGERFFAPTTRGAGCP